MNNLIYLRFANKIRIQTIEHSFMHHKFNIVLLVDIFDIYCNVHE